MKINLECGNVLLNGYLNVTSIPLQLDDNAKNIDIIMGRYDQLDPILKNTVAEEIIFNPPINKVEPNKLPEVLLHWRQYLQPNGILKIFLIDIRRISNYIRRGTLDLQQIHNYVLGQSNEYRSVIDTRTMKDLLEKLGFKIEIISPVEFITTIEARKI